LLHRRRRALGNLAAEIERHDLVRDRHYKTHVVLDEEHADPAIVTDPPDHFAEFEDLLVI